MRTAIATLATCMRKWQMYYYLLFIITKIVFFFTFISNVLNHTYVLSVAVVTVVACATYLIHMLPPTQLLGFYYHRLLVIIHIL